MTELDVDDDADTHAFFARLEKVEIQHRAEVGAPSPVDNGIFRKLVQDVGQEYTDQVKSLKKKLKTLANKWRDEKEVLQWEIEQLTRNQAALSHAVAAEGSNLLPELIRQVEGGASQELISHLLMKFGQDPYDIDCINESVARYDERGRGLLHLCASCVSSDPSKVAANINLLAERRCDPQLRSNSGETALDIAACHSNVPVIEALLTRRASPNSSNESDTPLKVCVRKSDLAGVRLLLNWRADPNCIDPMNDSALMEAASQDNVELCELLLEHRADPSAENSFNLKAVDYANDPSVEDLLRCDYAAGPTSGSRGVERTDAELTENQAVYEIFDLPHAGIDDFRSHHSAGPSRGVVQRDHELTWTPDAQQVRAKRKGEFVQSPNFPVQGLRLPVWLEYRPKGALNQAKDMMSVTIKSEVPVKEILQQVSLYGPTWDTLLSSWESTNAGESVGFRLQKRSSSSQDEIVTFSLRPASAARRLEVLYSNASTH